jgi:hypothetical protein
MDKKTKFVFFTFTGASLAIAKQLQDEGQDVTVAMVQKPEQLGIDGWQGKKEDPETQKRRLSLYNGILKKYKADKVYQALKKIKNKENYFVVTDHNALYNWGKALLKLGYTGFMQNVDDYDREKDREAAHEFVKKYYQDIHLMESFQFDNIEEGITAVEESDHLWVLKSNGNIGETIIPKVEDVELNKMEIISALKNGKADYEKEGFLLEEKIMDPIEFTPQIAFWNGIPFYSLVEIECKPMGAGDTGPDGGGAINVIVKTNLDDEINKLCFPSIVYEMAKKRKGLFFFDAGILWNPKDDKYYFTEFAGNRWSWGGVFSELSMAENGDRIASEYFDHIQAGLNPLHHKFGSTVSIYNIARDFEFGNLFKQDMFVVWKPEARKHLYFYQIKQVGDNIVNVGYNDNLFAYIGGNGETIEEAADNVYESVESMSLKEMLYRPKSDFLCREYRSAIRNRYDFLVNRCLIKDDRKPDEPIMPLETKES